MKMTSSTSITSTRGVVLISAMGWVVPPLSNEPKPCPLLRPRPEPEPARRGGLSGDRRQVYAGGQIGMQVVGETVHWAKISRLARVSAL